MILFTIFLYLLQREIICDGVVSSEKNNVQKERSDKQESNIDLTNRRFIEDLDDSEWHVAHLKDTEFSRRSECVGDTLEDKVRKYRKTLKNDGAFVEFVSADPLPFNKTDLEITKKCQAPTNYTIFMKYFKSKTNDDRSYTKPGEENKRFENGTIDKEIHDTATTAKAKSKESLGKEGKVRNKTGSRRASEYQFSSVEYYDEVTEFDEDMCPHDIEVITLEIDQLRSYDVECESILEWRSLE